MWSRSLLCFLPPAKLMELVSQVVRRLMPVPLVPPLVVLLLSVLLRSRLVAVQSQLPVHPGLGQWSGLAPVQQVQPLPLRSEASPVRNTQWPDLAVQPLPEFRVEPPAVLMH